MFAITRHGAVAVVTLDRPPLNVFRLADWAALGEAVARLEADREVGALVFHGGGARAFSAGNDFREFPAIDRDTLDRSTAQIRDTLQAIHGARFPSIAAVHGACAGSAMLLACCCDIRLATADAAFSLPEVKVGAIGGYQIVRALLPPGEARMLALAGEALPAARAHQLGFVQRLVEADRLRDAAVQLGAGIRASLRTERAASARCELIRPEEDTMWAAHERERGFILDYMAPAP